MGQLNLIEQTGHGVPLIVSKYGRNVFEITENFITVTLPFSKENEERDKIVENEMMAINAMEQ